MAASAADRGRWPSLRLIPRLLENPPFPLPAALLGTEMLSRGARVEPAGWHSSCLHLRVTMECKSLSKLLVLFFVLSVQWSHETSLAGTLLQPPRGNRKTHNDTRQVTDTQHCQHCRMPSPGGPPGGTLRAVSSVLMILWCGRPVVSYLCSYLLSYSPSCTVK